MRASRSRRGWVVAATLESEVEVPVAVEESSPDVLRFRFADVDVVAGLLLSSPENDSFLSESSQAAKRQNTGYEGGCTGRSCDCPRGATGSGSSGTIICHGAFVWSSCVWDEVACIDEAWWNDG
eukprot:scaffold194935_cov43-Attheya_sp.AAC.1